MIITIDTYMVPNLTGDFLKWLGTQEYTVTVETKDGEVYEGELHDYDPAETEPPDSVQGWLELLLLSNGDPVRIRGAEILKIDI